MDNLGRRRHAVKLELESDLDRALDGRALLPYEATAKILGLSVGRVSAKVAAGQLEARGTGRGRVITSSSIRRYVMSLPSSAALPAERLAS